MMQCPSCHAELTPDDRFCGECGTPVTATSPEPATSPPAESWESTYDIVLVSPGSRVDDAVEAVIRHSGWSENEARLRLARAPQTVVFGAVRQPAEEIKAEIEQAGASVKLQPHAGRRTPYVAGDGRLTEGVLKSLLAAVYPAMGGPDRPGLNGARLIAAPGELTAVASDGTCLVMARRALEFGQTSRREATLPRRMVARLIDELGDGDAPVGLELSETGVSVSFGGNHVGEAPLDAPFPDFNRVIPAKRDMRLTVELEALLDLLNGMFDYARDARSAWHLSPGRLTVTEFSPLNGGKDMSSARDIPAAYDGPPLLIGLDAQLVLRLVSRFDSDELDIFFSGPLQPVLITPKGRADPQFVVMPYNLGSKA